MSSRHTPHITTQRGLISELTRTLQIVGQSRAAASSSLMPCWADFTIASRGYSFRKGHDAECYQRCRGKRSRAEETNCARPSDLRGVLYAHTGRDTIHSPDA